MLIRCNCSKIAGEYDQRNAGAIAQLERDIEQQTAFIGVKQGARLLDYACGTGMLSRVSYLPRMNLSGPDMMETDVVLQVLAKYTSETIGIDLSKDMVGVYNAQAKSQVSLNHLKQAVKPAFGPQQAVLS